MEYYAIALLSGGLGLAVLAWLWLLVRTFQQGAWWGVLSFVLPPTAPVFALRHAQKAIAPLVIFTLGSVLAAVPVGYSLLGPDDLGLREQIHGKSGILTLVAGALQSDAAHEWMEMRAFYMQSGGVALAVLAWIWLLVRAFRQHRRWGLGSLVLPPVGLIFAGRYPRKGVLPVLLVLVCLFVALTPAIYTNTVPRDTSPRSRTVNGEEHLTLTGTDSKSKDAPDLKLRRDLSLLQMAKPDVTDQSLEPLRDMKVLRELDLTGSQVTDAGLEILKDLPALTSLRLARTKITDKGFRASLLEKESLMQLDVRGTGVSRETIQEWHDAKPGCRVRE